MTGVNATATPIKAVLTCEPQLMKFRGYWMLCWRWKSEMSAMCM